MAAVTIWSPSAVISGSKKIKSVTLSNISPSICHEVMGHRCHYLSFLNVEFMPTFHSPFCQNTFIKRIFSSSSLSSIRVVSSAYLRLLIFLLAILIPTCASSSPSFSWCTLHISYISRVTIYSIDILLSQFGTSLLFHVQF